MKIQVINEDESGIDLVDIEELEKEKKVLKKSLDILKDEDKKEKGKIIMDENKEETRVGLKVYKKYFALSGGPYIYGLILLMMCAFTAFKLLADYWIGAWAKSLSSGKNSNFAYYCSLSFTFTFLISAMIFFRTMI